MPRARRHHRALQIGFLALLVFVTVQLLWWIYDQQNVAARMHRRATSAHEIELQMARELLAAGVAPERVRALSPHLAFVQPADTDAVAVGLDPAARAAADDERATHLRRYLWEGGFFLVVLAACMAVIWRTLREEAELRQRQDNFIAAVTHELKSPLASLQLSAETIKLRRPTGERLGELVDRMGSDIDRLEGMVSQILDTARLEANPGQVEKEPVELARAVAAAIADLGERASAAKVAIGTEIPAELTIDANPLATRTVVRNLLENALKATAARGGGSITFRGRAHDGHVHLEASDDGVGFEPAEASKLFEKFYRPGDEMRRTGRGAGLGLYIVDRLMQLERGWVSAHSDGPGRGATFTVAWPRFIEPAPAARRRLVRGRSHA